MAPLLIVPASRCSLGGRQLINQGHARSNDSSKINTASAKLEIFAWLTFNLFESVACHCHARFKEKKD